MKVKPYIFSLMLMVSLVLLTSCGFKSKNSVDHAVINQILGNRNTLQENATYLFDKGKLNVMVKYVPFRNPNTEPTDQASQEIFENDLLRFNQEFITEELVLADFENMFERELSDVTLRIDKNKQEVSLNGQGIKKVFKISAENDKRLIDEAGIEYELITE